MSWGKEFKQLYNSPETVLMNIQKVYSQCTENDVLEGKGWYKSANLLSLTLSEKYSVDYIKVAGIIAALSPMKSWELNKQMAEQFLETKGRVSSHTLMQSNKARKILKYAKNISDIETCLGGLKTINFFNNIRDPDSRNYLTVDRHHIYISTGHDMQSCTPKQYEFLKENTVIFANKIDMVPNQLQSILWVGWKRMKKE